MKCTEAPSTMMSHKDLDYFVNLDNKKYEKRPNSIEFIEKKAM